MRSVLYWLAAALMIGQVGTAQTTAAQDRRPGVAVLPLFNGGSYGRTKEDLTPLSVGLQQSLMYEVAATANLRLVDRADIKRLLDEQKLGTTGEVDPATAAR